MITDIRPAVALRLGSQKALINGVRTMLGAAPFLRDGVVYLPTDALVDVQPSGEIITEGGAKFATAVKDAYINIDSMGLIMIDRDPEITTLNHNEHRDYMMNLMAEMLFDIERVPMKAGQYAPATEEQRAAYKRIGADIIARLGARGAVHPCIFGSAEIFARLRELYERGEESMRGIFTAVLAECERLSAREEFALNPEENGLLTPITMPADFVGGYDVGGRHSFSEGKADVAVCLAFGYLITGKALYAKQAYYIIRGICDFEHWGPGHFLNCAGAAALSATVYDWLYHAWGEMGLDRGIIKREVYSHGIYQGYLSAIHDRSDYPSAKQGTGWRFKAKPDNWNAVCNGNLIVAALSFLTDGVDDVLGQEEIDITAELIGCSLATISHGSLVLKQYAPDGSYVESNSYWSYGTSALFRAIGALYDALGTDLGLSLSGGLDKTCYYALSAESADFVGWNYHDGSLGSQNSSIFNLFATVSGDHALYAFRDLHVRRGKSANYLDLLYHPLARGYEMPKLTAPALDCYMEGIDALVVRDGWESGSLYAGIMGGYNPNGGSHNQLDSGSFVYHNHGVLWLTDMGPDYYNITGGYFGNYKLYRRCAEGNNVLSLPSIDYGQLGDATGYLYEYRTDTTPYAIIDNHEVYGDKVTVAKRGMLLTNGRRTTVIQDEVEFVAPTDAYWVAHFNSSEITVAVSNDGEGVLLTHKDGKSIAIRAIGDAVRFTVRDCYDFLLPTTDNFEGERDRSSYSRLVIEYKGTEKINLAIVIEDESEHGYDKVIPMDEWVNI